MIQSPAGYQGDVRIKRYLDFYQAGYGVAMLSSGVAFSPLSLFAQGEQGGWYDPSDLTTMFQDAAGTTAAALESPVGLVLDKSKGLVLGSELLPATDASDWTVYAANTVADDADGSVRVTFVDNAFGASLSLSGLIPAMLNVSKTFKVTLEAKVSTGSANVRVQNLVTASSIGAAITSTTYVSQQFIGTWDGSGGILLDFTNLSAGEAINIRNISVRELPGNHLSQSTSTARPVLSARVNLLTYSEQFDNAVWQISSAGVATVTKSTTNAAVAPDGTTTADRVLFNLNGGTTTTDVALLRQAAGSAGDYTFSIAVRSFDGTSSYVMQLIKPDGTGQNITVTGSWQRFVVSGTASGAINYGIRLRGGQSPANSDSADVLIWGADLRPSNAGVGLPAYQRVGAATSGSSSSAGTADYDATGFPYYLRWDGTDDGMASGSINFTSTDKVSVVAGARKLSDAAIGMMVELSDADTNTGSLYIAHPIGTGGNIRASVRGNVLNQLDFGPYVAPVTSVLAAAFSTDAANSGAAISLKVNGSSVSGSSVVSSNSTGNFGNYPLYVGSRAGSSLRFNGHIYGLVIVGRALTAGEIASMETWMNSKTKAF